MKTDVGMLLMMQKSTDLSVPSGRSSEGKLPIRLEWWHQWWNGDYMKQVWNRNLIHKSDTFLYSSFLFLVVYWKTFHFFLHFILSSFFALSLIRTNISLLILLVLLILNYSIRLFRFRNLLLCISISLMYAKLVLKFVNAQIFPHTQFSIKTSLIM